jgi:hypothetical protein
MLHVVIVRTGVSEERIAYIIKVMETLRPSETSGLIKATRRNIPEDGILRLRNTAAFNVVLSWQFNRQLKRKC